MTVDSKSVMKTCFKAQATYGPVLVIRCSASFEYTPYEADIPAF